MLARVNGRSSGEKDGDDLREGHTLLGGVGQDEGLLSPMITTRVLSLSFSLVPDSELC